MALPPNAAGKSDGSGSRPRSPLRDRHFRRLFIGQTVSSVGDQMFPVAVAIKVLNAHGGAAQVGLVMAARFGALVLFLLVGGVFADRWPRRKVMIGADVTRALAVIGLVLTPGHVAIGVLAALVFVVGAGQAFFQPAYSALVPTLLESHQLERANALASVSVRGASVLGPSVAGAVVATSGPTLAFVIDAATFLVSLVSLMLVTEPSAERVAGPPTSVLTEALDGIRAVKERPWIAAILAMASIQLMVAIAPETVLLPVISRERLGGDAVYGTVLATFGLGAVCGALIGGRWRPREPGTVALLLLTCFGFAPLALLVHIGPVLVAAAYFVAGITLEPFMVWWASALARDVPRHLLARVTSLDWLCSLGLLPVGLALTGPAVDAFGRTAVLATGVVLSVLPNLAVLLVPGVRRLGTPRPDGLAGAAAEAGA